MKSFLKSLLAGLLAVTLTGPVAVAQERPAFSEEELDQMLAPIALYPDSLLSQILMASTYPLEVVQAARWSRANSQLKGDDAVKAVEGMDWDPSVKSLVAFPQILHRMDERLDWTQRLGEAFLAQEPHVLDAIQGLRQRAAAAGNLNSNEQMRVTRQDEAILIEPARPETVYVPYYNPAVVYGPWAWTGYPPVYWGPFPGYYAAPAFSPAFFWGPAIVVSTGFFFGHCNWHHRHVTVVHKHVQVVQSRFGKPHTVVTSVGKPAAWKHDPAHRKGVPYRHAALRKEFGRPGANGGDARRDNHRPDAAVGTHNRDGGRPAGFRDGRPDERRDSVNARDGRETAPVRRFQTQQGQDGAPDGRGRPSFDSDGRGSRFVNPAAPNSQRRSESGRDNAQAQGRRFDPQSAPAAPVARQEQHPAAIGNNVLRFQGRSPAPQTAPAAPTARQGQHPATVGNNVLRFQGHSPVPRIAPVTPTVRQEQRPAVAVPQRNGQQAAAPQVRFRPPVASNNGDRGQLNRQVFAPRVSSPAPQARSGNPVSRMGNGNHRGNGAAGGRGGASIR
jgi:hypothetical protein